IGCGGAPTRRFPKKRGAAAGARPPTAALFWCGFCRQEKRRRRESPELGTPFGGAVGKARAVYSSPPIWGGRPKPNRIGPGPYGLGTWVRSRSPLFSYTQKGASFH